MLGSNVEPGLPQSSPPITERLPPLPSPLYSWWGTRTPQNLDHIPRPGTPGEQLRRYHGVRVGWPNPVDGELQLELSGSLNAFTT